MLFFQGRDEIQCVDSGVNVDVNVDADVGLVLCVTLEMA